MHSQPDLLPALCIWFTGLSGAGKTTLAYALRDLSIFSKAPFVLDGDVLREGLSRDLGFGCADREENVRRAAEVARLLYLSGVPVIVAMMSPFSGGREHARSLFPEGRFFEIFLETPLVECEKRDPKGLYEKARRDEIANTIGIDIPYESSIRPDLLLDTSSKTVGECLDEIIGLLQHGEKRF